MISITRNVKTLGQLLSTLNNEISWTLDDVSVDALLAAFSLYRPTQFDILCDIVKTLQPNGFRKGLVECVKRHRAIVKY